MKKKFTSVLLFLALGIGVASAQTSKISGKVIGEDGEPVIGASIIVKGMTIGTVTDFDGNFTLDVPADGTHLVVSFIGMRSQEVKVQSKINVTLLADTQKLDEVVVTAMGIKRERKELGYAAQDLKSDDLNKSGTTSLASAIQGKLTGVDIRQSSGAPGASAQITIRGARSFDGNNQPLYVIDGMPINTSADFDTGASVTGSNYADRSIDINPEDIETINVLKGQAASALYGIRASNGVIVITTKRGSTQKKGRPQVTFSTNLSAQRVSRKFDRQDVYAQGNSIDAYNPSGSMTWGPKISDLANDPVYGGNTDNAYTKAEGMHQGMYYNPKLAQAGLDGWTSPQIYDNVGDFLGTT